MVYFIDKLFVFYRSCKGFYDLDDDMKVYLMETDQLPADLPEEPSLPWLLWIKGFLFWIVLAIVLIGSRLFKNSSE